jgi:hypothetical protein
VGIKHALNIAIGWYVPYLSGKLERWIDKGPFGLCTERLEECHENRASLPIQRGECTSQHRLKNNASLAQIVELQVEALGDMVRYHGEAPHINDMVDLEPGISALVDEHFWELLL